MTRRWRIGRVCVLRHAGMPFDWLEELGADPALLRAADAVLDAEQEIAQAGGAVAAGLRAGEPDRLPPLRAERWRVPLARWRQALAEFQAAYALAEDDASERLAEVLGRDRVPEAVFLSNPDVYRNMLRPFLSGRRGLNSRVRRTRRQLYTYVQRFCAKNETVSFFGPMAYGTEAPGADATVRRSEPQRCRVFLASWAARELAAAIAGDRELRTRLPFRSTGDTELPGGTIAEIAAATGRGLRETAEWLSGLVRDGAVEFGVAAAPYDLDPPATMLERLMKLPASPARDLWLERLDELGTLLRRLELTPFPERIELVTQIEAVFTAATGVSARRSHGAIYADRAVFYEECSSPFALTLGAELLREWERRLAAAMELCTEHGWASWTAAQRLITEALPGGQAMDFVTYGNRLRAVFEAGGSTFTAAHMPAYGAADAEDLVAAGRSRPGERYAVIDLCPLARTADGLGDADLLLGRCHHQLLTDGWLATMHPDRAEFAHSAEAWLAGQPQLVGMDVGRRNKGYYRFPGRRILLRPRSHADAGMPQTLAPSSITVRTEGARVRCLDADGAEISLYLPLTDYGKYPPYAALSAPQVLHAAFGDTEAVRVGGVLYQRPRWIVEPAEFALTRPDARFLALRRLARRAGGVRFVFCRSDAERKPYLIDLESVLAADLAGHITGERLIAERMLPGPDELWLRDENGRRYTCELRMQITGREDS